LKHRGLLQSDLGFTLQEVLIVIVLMGIVLAITSSSWFGVVESRQVDSATNQMVSDLRLAHTRATNRLVSYEVSLTAGNSTYDIGPSGTPQTRTLPDDAEVDTTVSIVFNPDGSASATPSSSPIAFKVRAADDSPDHDIQINTATSRVRVID
jgi:prepilin-type N-terminal cleavage/methylation domain-containing protein